MPKKGQTRPYKVIYRYPSAAAPSTVPMASAADALREGGAIGKRGAEVTVVFRETGTPDKILAQFGPGVEHTTTAQGDRFACTCGAHGAVGDPFSGLKDHREDSGSCRDCGAPHCEGECTSNEPAPDLPAWMGR